MYIEKKKKIFKKPVRLACDIGGVIRFCDYDILTRKKA